MTTVRRPIIRYHGGKWQLARWILDFFPEHKIYVEPFGGGGSVLLQKSPCYAEIYNDLDEEIVNLFRMARNRGQELHDALILTPFSRTEYLEAWYPSDDPLEQARRTVIRAFMGFGSASATMGRSINNQSRGGLAKTGFRSNSNRAGNTPAHDWANYPAALKGVIERLRKVVIENEDAIKIMRQHDSPKTLFYVDPPYLPETRDKGGDYKHELTIEQHIELATFLKQVQGMVVLSGYPSELYNELYSGWRCVTKAARADGAQKRTECLWLSKVTEKQGSLAGI